VYPLTQMVLWMFSCVTRGSTNPGVHTGSGRPFVVWHSPACWGLAVGVGMPVPATGVACDDSTGVACDDTNDCQAKAIPSVSATRQMVNRTRRTSRPRLGSSNARMVAGR